MRRTALGVEAAACAAALAACGEKEEPDLSTVPPPATTTEPATVPTPASAPEPEEP